MAEMAVQTPEKSASPAGERARFFNSGNAFNIQLPPVPDHVFTEERDRVLDSDAPHRLRSLRSLRRTGRS